jgi:hypothetical protein
MTVHATCGTVFSKALVADPSLDKSMSSHDICTRKAFDLPRSYTPPPTIHICSLFVIRLTATCPLTNTAIRNFSRTPAQKQYLASMTTSLTQAQPEASQSRPRNLLLLCPSRWLLPIGFQTLQTQPSTPRFNLCNPWLLPKCRDTRHVQSPSYIPRHETKPPPLHPSAIYSFRFHIPTLRLSLPSLHTPRP